MLASGSMEASKRYYEKLNRDPIKLKEYREKAAERMRRRRAELSGLAKNNGKLLKDKREKDRIRQEKLRLKKKNDAQKNDAVEPYICKQTFGKAVKKLENALPKDIARKVKVIEALYKKYVQQNASENTSAHSFEMKSKLKVVNAFYNREDISVQSAGRKDTIIIDKEIVPKRFMLVTVSEACEIYNRVYWRIRKNVNLFPISATAHPTLEQNTT